MTGILIDSNCHAVIEDGHLAIGDNTASTANLLIVSNRGDFKEYPLLGGEAQKLIGSSEAKMWAARLKKQLTQIGIDVSSLSVEDDQISIEL